MCEHAKAKEGEIILCVRYQGFIRIAMQVAQDYQERVKIVPIVAFGEAHGIKNLFSHWVSRSSYRYLVFPFPFIPKGIYGTPFPTRDPLYLAIGSGIKISEKETRSVKDIHEAYYAQVQELFEKHKKLAKNCAHLKLRPVRQ